MGKKLCWVYLTLAVAEDESETIESSDIAAKAWICKSKTHSRHGEQESEELLSVFQPTSALLRSLKRAMCHCYSGSFEPCGYCRSHPSATKKTARCFFLRQFLVHASQISIWCRSWFVKYLGTWLLLLERFLSIWKLVSFLALALLRSETPSGICAKLRTVATSNNRVHIPWSLYYCLFAPHIRMVLFFTHIPFVVNHTINATPPERLQQHNTGETGKKRTKLGYICSRFFEGKCWVPGMDL